jgi:nitroreductase
LPFIQSTDTAHLTQPYLSASTFLHSLRLANLVNEGDGRWMPRDFSDRPVPRKLVEEALAAASSAPSGANLQPWHFVVVSAAKTKKEIRTAADEEERLFYEQRAPEEWLDALRPLGLDANKPFLETAPYIIAIFLEKYTTE